MQLDESQVQAVTAARDNPHCFITGGAGTGKTTIIKAIADDMEHCELMAPTGKAAARLKEATGYDACTIHRALMWTGDEFMRHGDFSSPVIVDESSMVDSWLLARLLDFHPPKIILVGDSAQLAPVGHGQPFHDLLKIRPDLTHTLIHCWRAQGAVHKAAQAIREGKHPETNDKSGGEAFRLQETGNAKKTVAQLIKWVEQGHFDPTQDIILSARYGDGEEDGGIDSINKAVRAIVNPSLEKWAVGDRVLNCKNFSDLDYWNGDLGTITDIDTDGFPWVTLDRNSESPVLCRKEQTKELKHAYCLSIHKSQGSQFRRVYLVVLKNHWHMLSRSLVYTGVTRAQKGCMVIGQLSAFYHALNELKPKRTILQHLGENE